MGLPVNFQVKLDGGGDVSTSGPPGRFGLTATTEAGLPFFVPAVQETANFYRAALPPGTYQLKVSVGDREAPLEGMARVTITRRDAQQFPNPPGGGASAPDRNRSRRIQPGNGQSNPTE